MADEEDEGGFGGLYEDGHWAWDDSTKELVFISDLPPELIEAIQIPTKAPTGAIEFRDDIDLIEQIRFRRRYQRKLKPGQPDIITIQDVKDIALYTAPVNILSPMLINVLHIPTTERFLRALILCCQYYLQIADEMANRIIELETKVRTPQGDVVESEFRNNLSDLRLLVAKEYSTMLIELEVSRVFKSEIFNSTEHRLQTNYIAKMAREEKSVLLGHCVRHDKKLNTCSPLMNEVFCHRYIDYRMMGLGVIKCTQPSPRLLYMLHAIAGSEENFSNLGIVLGIIGLQRSTFDTMLRPLPTATGGEGKSKASISSRSYSSKSTTSSSIRKSQLVSKKQYPDIVLPRKDSRIAEFPSQFPDEPEEIPPCSETQRRRWQNRLQRLLHPH
nr:uncharacterized protein LOC117983358 isoform X3 [Maniola hyperantus]